MLQILTITIKQFYLLIKFNLNKDYKNKKLSYTVAEGGKIIFHSENIKYS